MEFQHFEHGADVGVRGFGSTVSEAFEGAAQALFALLTATPSAVQERIEERFELDAPDLEELFVAFLNELISLSDTRHLVFGNFTVGIERAGSGGYRLTARARGEPFDPKRHAFTVQPKGATYTALRVGREGNRWLAQCVVDV